MTTTLHAENVEPELTIIADAVTEYRSSSPHGNRVHGVLGTEHVDVVLRPAGLRTGRLELALIDEAAAYAAEQALRAGVVWSLTSDDRPTINMRCVVADDGSVTRELERETHAAWLVGFDWQEVGT